jgi:hypothetical protein
MDICIIFSALKCCPSEKVLNAIWFTKVRGLSISYYGFGEESIFAPPEYHSELVHYLTLQFGYPRFEWNQVE